MSHARRGPLIAGLGVIAALTALVLVVTSDSDEQADPQPQEATATTHFTSQVQISNCQVTGDVPEGNILKAEVLGEDCVVTIDRTQHSLRLIATTPEAAAPTTQSATARQDIMASWRQQAKVYAVVYPKANNLFCFLFAPDQAAQPLPNWAGAAGLPAITVPRYGEDA